MKHQQFQLESASHNTQSTIGSNNSLPLAAVITSAAASRCPARPESYCAASTPSPFVVSGSSEAASAVAKACIIKQRSPDMGKCRQQVQQERLHIAMQQGSSCAEKQKRKERSTLLGVMRLCTQKQPGSSCAVSLKLHSNAQAAL